MDRDRDPRPLAGLRALAQRLDATPSEAAGLALLLAGAALVSGLVWWRAQPASAPAPLAAPTPAATAPTASPTTVTVHVVGAVESPGLVQLPSSARIADAIAAAGGARADALLEAVNLARTVSDGEQLIVPSTADGSAAPPPGAGSPPSGARRPDGRLDLNRATAAELEELPGIGPVLAERIVAWREANGPFADVGGLREVSGIGERTFQQLADEVAAG